MYNISIQNKYKNQHLHVEIHCFLMNPHTFIAYIQIHWFFNALRTQMFRERPAAVRLCLRFEKNNFKSHTLTFFLKNATKGFWLS